MSDNPSSPRQSKVDTTNDVWADEVDAEDFKPLTRDEAQQWRQRQPQTSVWRVVGWQAALALMAPWIALWLTQRSAVAWSVFYGGLCVVLPSALMAYGVTSSALSRMLARRFPGAGRLSLAGVFFWEGVKVLLSLAMLWSAPHWVPDLSWLGLLAGLVVSLKAYWLVFWQARRLKR